MRRESAISLALVALLAAPCALAQADNPGAKLEKETEGKEKKSGEKSRESDQLFQRDKVWTLHLIVTPEEWKKIEPLMRGGPPGMMRGAPRIMLAQSFLRAGDANKDGKLTSVEFNQAFAKWFAHCDEDKNHALSEAEMSKGLGQLLAPPDFAEAQASPDSSTKKPGSAPTKRPKSSRAGQGRK